MLMVGAVLLTLLCQNGSAIAEECKSSQLEFWLCKGDKAWYDGYLVTADKIKKWMADAELLRTVTGEREEYRDLLGQMQAQRDMYKEQRDVLRDLLDQSKSISEEYRRQQEGTESDLSRLELMYESQSDELTRLRSMSSWSDLEVGLLASGTAVLGGLIGVGIYALSSP